MTCAPCVIVPDPFVLKWTKHKDSTLEDLTALVKEIKSPRLVLGNFENSHEVMFVIFNPKTFSMQISGKLMIPKSEEGMAAPQTLHAGRKILLLLGDQLQSIVKAMSQHPHLSNLKLMCVKPMGVRTHC